MTRAAATALTLKRASVARARQEGALYVVVNHRDFRNSDTLRALLDAHAEHRGLRFVGEFDESTDQRVLVYEVEGVEH